MAMQCKQTLEISDVKSLTVNASSRNGRFFTQYYYCKIAMYYTTEATFLYNGEV